MASSSDGESGTPTRTLDWLKGELQRAEELGDHDRSMKLSLQMIAEHPVSPAGYQGQVTIHKRLGEPSQVHRLCIDAARRFPQHAWWRAPLFDAALELGLLNSVEACEAHLRISPGDIRVLEVLAKAHAEAQDWDRQWDAYIRITESDDTRLSGWRGRFALSCAERTTESPHQLVPVIREKFGEHSWWLDEILEFFIRNDQIPEAIALLTDEVARRHEPEAATIRLVRLLQTQRDWRGIRALDDHSSATIPTDVSIEAAVRLGLAETTRAEIAERDLAGTAPETHAHLGLVAEILGDEQTAAQHRQAAMALSPESVEYQAGWIRALLQVHRLEEAKELIDRLAQSEGASSDIAGLRFQHAVSSMSRDQSLVQAEAAFGAFPNNQSFRFYMVNALSDVGRFEEAEALLDQFAAQTPSTWAKWQITLRRAMLLGWQFRHDEAWSLGLEVLGSWDKCPGFEILLQPHLDDLERLGAPADLVEQSLEVFDQIPADSGISIAAKIRLLVLGGFHAEALGRVARIAPQWRLHKRVLSVIAWAEMRQGDDDAAKESGKRWSSKGLDASQRRRVDTFELIVGSEQFDRNEIVAIVPTWNEESKIGETIAHLRLIGADRIVLFDNCSDDDTVEIAEAAACDVIRIADDFGDAASATRWVNHFLDTNPGLGWVAMCDADEHLIFPGCETAGLTRLTQYLDAEGFDLVRAFMLDMYPDDMAATSSPGNTLREKHPNFLNNYHKVPTVLSPYTDVVGGIRDALGIRRKLVKAPVLNAQSGVRYFWPHHTTPARVADISAVLLHYPFADDVSARADAEMARSTMYYFVNRKRQHGDATTRTPESLSQARVRYTDSLQLESLGLLVRPTAYPSG